MRDSEVRTLRSSFGEIDALRLKTTIYCSACYEHRPIDPAAERPICTTEENGLAGNTIFAESLVR